MFASRVVGTLVVLLAGTSCLIDPMGKARQRVSAGEAAIARSDYVTAHRELDAAEQAAEDDVVIRRRIRVARQALDREFVRARAATITSDGSITTVTSLWALRASNAGSGGSAATEEQLLTKMRESASLFLQEQDRLAASGRPWAAVQAGLKLLVYPGVEDEIGVGKRITALANQAASVHIARAQALAGAPLANRGHLGLAARYIGGTLADATALTASFVPRVEVRGTPAAACGPLATTLNQRLARLGQGRRVEVELALTDCRDSESATTAVAQATWIEMVPTPKSVKVWDKVCDYKSYPMKTESCTMIYDARSSQAVCSPVTTTTTYYVCTSVERWIDAIVPQPVERTGPRPVTTTTANVTVSGSYVVRKEGQPDRRGTIAQTLVRTDTSYPAVGTLASKEREERNRTPAMIAEAHLAIEAQLAKEIDASLAVDVEAALATARTAAAAGQRDLEEESLFRAVLLGATDSGELATRYGATAADVREAFAVTKVAAPVRLSISLPGVETIPELTVDERAEVERQIVTGLATPMTLPTWFTIGVGGFAVEERATPDGGAVLGTKGIAISARAGTMLLGRLRGTSFGPLLIDDAAVHIDGGFAVARAADQIDGGSRLVLGADYTAAVGWRTRRFGGLFAGVRATASYEALAGDKVASLPLFARLEIPLPTGTFTLEAFGRPIAGDAEVAGLTAYITGENRQRRDRSNLFFAIRIERGNYDAKATYTDAAFMDHEIEFPDVPVTTVGVEIGAGF